MHERLVVMGQGYVGGTIAVRAAEVGYDVVGYDPDEGVVKRLTAGEPTTVDVSPERLAAALGTGRYRVTADPGDLEGFDVAVITVPTPLREGAPDLTYIREAARQISTHLSPGACVILESTTYPGTTEELVAPALEAESGLTAGHDFALGYSPERIDPGSADWPFERIPKVVSGVDEASLVRVQAFYDSLVERTVPVSSPKVAEMTKLLENVFRHVNIALVNELAMFGGDLGIDVWEAIDAASTKPFGFMAFRPGPGAGGHCLPVDPSYLSWSVRQRLGESFRFIELANDVNRHMPKYVVSRLVVALNQRGLPVKGARILQLGLSYKPNTADTRESPAVRIAELVGGLGADLRLADPHVDPQLLDVPGAWVEADAVEVEAADAVLLVTDHEAFDLDVVAQRARFVLDCRHRLAGANVEYL